MGKDIRSGPLGNVGIGEIRIGSRLSNVRVPRVSVDWGLLALIPSWPVLLRIAPPRIVVSHLLPRQAFSASEDVPGEGGDCHPEDPFFRKEFCEEEQEGQSTPTARIPPGDNENCP